MSEWTIRRVWKGQGFEQALKLRCEVFCDEQKVPREMELDEEDELACHLVLEDGEGRVVATGRALRMRPDGRQDALEAPAGAGDVARLGRMAVRADHRGRGLGPGC